MKVDLKGFQIERCVELLDEIAAAREEFSRRRKLQALVFSSPTGSGKTITMAGLLEQLFRGGENHPARPYSRILWISDSPELNSQSRDKLLWACDEIAFDDLIMVDASYDTEYLPAGKIHFINTQLLGKDKKLIQNGDGRTWTFWQAVENTIRNYGEDFLLVIDEAHRGMGVSANERNGGTTIIRKFIDGSPGDGLRPVPIILGMSATTRRFDEFLAKSERTTRKITITSAEVQASGLLKDTLVVANPEGNVEGDMTLLSVAAEKWKEFNKLWLDYCTRENENVVRPILVVQVEDGISEKNLFSKTNLDEAIQVLRRSMGSFPHGALAHCFQEPGQTSAGGEIIRHIEASRVQDDPSVQVVFFKMALATGWDCPRAEVMMSFRRSVDHTVIAQLVGRMIRTPLARRVEGDEMLGTVSLYLPHYDRASLEKIVEELRNPDAEDRPPTNVETDLVPYTRNPQMTTVFEHLAVIPTYTVSKLRPLPPLKRLLRYASLLSIKDRIDEFAYERERDAIVDILSNLRKEKTSKSKDWAAIVSEGGEISLSVTSIDIADFGLPQDFVKLRVALTPENVHRLFQSCGRMLAPGEGLESAFWKRLHDPADPDRAKLELYALLRDPGTIVSLNNIADKRFAALEKSTRSKVNSLPEANRNRYREIVDRSGRPESHEWSLPERILERREEGTSWTNHLFCAEDGTFQAKLNTWEKAVIETQMRGSDFLGWLRNRQRASWALCVSYEFGGTRSFYPDFIVIRRKGDELIIDVLEPHRPNEDDTFAKAKGLAQYARTHGHLFGRLLILKVGWDHSAPSISGFDVNSPDTRARALELKSNNDVQALYLPLHE
jgi:type III restriction enzyme